MMADPLSSTPSCSALTLKLIPTLPSSTPRASGSVGWCLCPYVLSGVHMGTLPMSMAVMPGSLVTSGASG